MGAYLANKNVYNIKIISAGNAGGLRKNPGNPLITTRLRLTLRRVNIRGRPLTTCLDRRAGNEISKKYWNDLKNKIIKEGYSEVSEKIGQLKLVAEVKKDKQYGNDEDSGIQRQRGQKNHS